ncbi:MAG TPA: zinc-binding alcohol dehydrogenase family protein [Kofleriaceae bacterium]|jgi:NADPH:quinone reductase-like Zn-dependent oxidoreductase
MKAAVLHGPDRVPAYEDFADPAPAAGEIVVDVLAASLHHLTRGHALGKHYSSHGQFPSIPGVDGVGRRPDGQLIYFGGVRAPYGTFAERAATRGGLPLPAGLDPQRAAAMMNAAASSWLALSCRAPIEAGATVLVVGATGASGSLALQIARHLGATRVIAVGRRRDALAALHPDAALTPDDKDALVAEFARGVDVVLDYVWGAPAQAMFAAIMAAHSPKRLRYVNIGALAGDAQVHPHLLRSLPIELLGSGIGSVSQAQWAHELPRILAALPAFTLRFDPVPLADVAAAWQREGGDRVVIVP